MVDERDDDQFDGKESSAQATAGQRSDQSEYGSQGRQTMGNQGAEGSFGGESVGSQSGSADRNGSSIAGGANDGMSGQPIGGNDSNTGSGTTLTQGADFQGQSSSGQAQPTAGDTLTTDQGGAGANNSGQGFIGSQGSGSDDYVQDRTGSESSSSAEATGASDFANEGRGALDDENDDESGSSS